MKNHYEIRGDVTAIFVNHKGNVIETIIDTEDLEKVSFFPCTWCTNGNYITQRINKCWIMMHREIMDSSLIECKVDHINRNKLDNRKVNLRFCTQAENMQNLSEFNENSSSGKRGVSWSKYHQKWSAVVKLNQKKHFIGYFDNVEDADKAVKDARSKLMPFSPEAELNPNALKYHKDKEKPLSTNALGLAKYVTFEKSKNRYAVRIVRNKQCVFFKRYKTIEEALEEKEKAIKKFGIA